MLSKGHFFLDWEEGFKAGAEKAGGKGWNLGRLAKYGFPVPAGGILSADAYELFLRENDLNPLMEKISAGITPANLGDDPTEQALNALRKKIIHGKMPDLVVKDLVDGLGALNRINSPVAVRSSATLEDSKEVSFAGIHDSFLNVAGTENILKGVKECYASLWTTRAVAYRRKKILMMLPCSWRWSSWPWWTPRPPASLLVVTPAQDGGIL